MNIVSIEPTPSPNVMKLNLDTPLPEGVSYNFTFENKDQAPQHIRQLLDIEGIKGVYQVKDFIAIERNPKIDWRAILPKLQQVFGEGSIDVESMIKSTAFSEDEVYGGVQVFIQTIKGIPMQVKLTTPSREKRYALPQRFLDAAMRVQQAVSNLITERKWEEQGVRYGELDEIGEQVVEEINAAYDDERLGRLVDQALGDQDARLEEQPLSAAEAVKRLDHPDWKARYKALEQLELTEEDIPVLAKAIDDPHMSIRRLAVAYLGEIGGKKVLPLLYKALQDKSPAVCRTAGDALSDIGDPEAMEHMIEALSDSNKLVRWRAARFLYEVGDHTAIPALREALNDPEFEISLQARMALERIEKGQKAEGTVWQQITRSMKNRENNEAD
ncbi:conserved virulence factor C family protein [Caldalkalibacillus thermarum TA2.A1]|uniref:Conserved virulence factor C family protein n=1 Tax=Caldalkalibacillus thermarum (strain TA2.A1) TaxID=986075 RepID=A0A8X8IC46_CALTT|nr:conserved virulence factor C family protein [Caldalkalibacillus thermarum]QZT35402.1 conserved virulence factor C family protein [Caldalkalibacillus thermarum TA2.A1]